MPDKGANSLRSSYLIKHFTILFFAFSLTPLILLFYLYFQYQGETTIFIHKDQFLWFTLGIAVISILGFFGVRGSLVRIVLLSDNLKKALFKKVVDEKLIVNLAQGEGEVAELAKSFGDIFKKLESKIEELEYTKHKLYQVLSKVGKALTSMENFDLLIQLILETTIDALEAEKGVIFSANEKGEFDLKSCVGFSSCCDADIVSATGASLHWVAREKNTLVMPQLSAADNQEKIFDAPLVWSPLIVRDKIWGVLCLSGKKTGNNFSEDELKIIYNLSSQIAISFENVSLNRDIERRHFETIAALALAVEAKDPYSRGHSERVGKCAVQLGREMGLSEKNIETLSDASRLHDLGKIGIDDRVLKKKSILSVEERETMLKHPIIGETIVKPLKTFQHLLDPIRHHHEYLDGSGYPDGLKGSEITLITRILTVADIFDALGADRPYRKALSRDKLKEEFWSLVEKGKIDRDVLTALLNLIEGNKL